MSDHRSRPDDAWVRGGGRTFGSYSDADECLHPDMHPPGDSLTETWAYMWYLPEHRIECFAFVWIHPNLGVVSGGIAVWQGNKNHHLAAELFDIRMYLSAAECGDGRDVTLWNGMRVQILRPFSEIKIAYTDPQSRSSVEVTLAGHSPPIMRANRTHFDQVVRAKGMLRLRGHEYPIDGYGLRDRSWGELRPEHPYAMPPYEWLTGTFPEAGISWHVAANDDPHRMPEWQGLFDVNEADVFKDGWVFRDGELLRLRSASVLTRRDSGTLRPISQELEFVDSKDREYRIRGTIIAALPWSSWHNSVCHLCMTRWEMNGEIGYGDTQEVQWNDFVWAKRGDQELGPPRSSIQQI
jgi:hypothetical protein